MGLGLVSKTAEFLWHHIPSFGQFRDTEPSPSLSLGTEGEGGDYWGHFSSLATSTQGCHSTLQLPHGGFKTHMQTLPQIRDGSEEAATGKFSPLAQSLGCSVLVLPLDSPSSQPPPAGLEQLHGTQSLSHPFFIFSSLIWPSSCHLAGCQVSCVLIPDTQDRFQSGPAPGSVSVLANTGDSAPRGDWRWCMGRPQDVPHTGGSSTPQAQGPGGSRSWDLSGNPQRELTQVLAEEERCAGRVNDCDLTNW